ncbi:TPM domain-containing protein [Pseudanabaena galeata UHCC 0370]|uniref:TPM domain-containing protein n=1 Tax=Pseudanabaena galeata UHCC 0370 TaxID=3110310 RepID=A0ABU5TE55_9CYAN|nr:TPM domain-containing protein [Pseudanabaena galeata]MEA5476412.1 TPM domain-containing protein [Pseudanabaena galeata UHCC 0370]
MKVKLTGIICLIFLLWVVLLPTVPLHAIPISDIPNPRKLNGTWVSDVANILSADTESRLNRRISQLAANNSSEIAVVTLPDTIPSVTVKAYATELFNTWGIGKRGIDNGVLFLISVNDRRIEIETGRGVSPYISDRQVKQIIEDLITPEFKRQNYDLGIIKGVEEIAGRLEKINFYPFPFMPIYSSIGLIGIAISLSGVILIVIKIREWRQTLPTVSKELQNPVVFRLHIPQLTGFTSLGMLLMVFGLAAIAVSINAWVLSQEMLTSLFIQPINQLLGSVLINLIVAFVSLILWLSIEKFWLAQLTSVFQTPIQRYETSRFSLELSRNYGWMIVCNFPALILLWLIISTSILLTIPSHLLFAIASLLMAMSYQFLWLYLVNDMYIDRSLAREQYFCHTCRNLVQHVASDVTNQYLTKPELKAIELGNATYTVYSCDRCYPATNQTAKGDRQHVYCQPNILKEETICPVCSYATMIPADLKQSRKPKKFPKKASKDAISMRQCQNCFHEEPVYPFIPAPVRYSSSNDYSSSSDSSSSSNSHDSYDYGSYSGSDFGGGGSDGGGAGGDW